jgi:hypothetical protein
VAGDRLCAIHQPNFFPRLSTLAKLFTADAWIILDDVQFARRDYQHRCRLAAAHDSTARQWLMLPPPSRGPCHADQERLPCRPSQGQASHGTAVAAVLPAHLSLEGCPGRLAPTLAAFDASDELASIAEQSTLAMPAAVGWPGVVYRSSDLAARAERSERLADLTCAVGANTYLCGSGGARYLDRWPFVIHGLSTALFTTPVSGNARIWHDARTITGLHALATVSLETLVQELGNRARYRRSSGCLLDSGETVIPSQQVFRHIRKW